MKEATIALPDDLIEALEAYNRDQGDAADLGALAQAALRTFLRERGYLSRPLHITPASVGSGMPDVSIEHDRELAAE